MDSLINLPNLVNLETGEIKWDLIKELSGETTEEMKKLKCKKCNKREKIQQRFFYPWRKTLSQNSRF